MTELIEYLENKIENCEALGMPKEKWAFIQTLKKVRELQSLQSCVMPSTAKVNINNKIKIMKNLLEILEEKFDEYHNKQLEIDNDQNPDYYLFMGKASAIGDLIDEIKSVNPVQDKKEEKCNHKESYFVYENNRKMHYERCCSCGSFLRESKDGINYIEFKSL